MDERNRLYEHIRHENTASADMSNSLEHIDPILALYDH
jgi:hypothetical protein